ncbi:hypothetical protein [Bradyrhizobium zhanjiangense]|uniref:hypothetical protein n=1 Tax=Bradyrhizobium zhanjiangense TaxID=1325107 RepID=UPI0013E8A7B9|nr:hypothetical protein [Bradyrhizobium zhanjiangense]
MSTHMWIRQIHRWLSMAFTLAVIANIVAMITQIQAVWIGFLALVPLIPLLATGLYLFARPYVSRSVNEAR